MDEWAREADEKFKLFYSIKASEIFVCSQRPGIWIGLNGKRFNKYKSKLKAAGASKVVIIEIHDARWDTL